MLSLSSQPSGSSEHASLQGEFTITDDDSITDPVAHLAPEKTGWLKKKKRKQHGLGSAWQPRYFELKGNRLYYFASEADGLPRGAVLLDHALVQRGRGDHAMAFSISSASSHRRLQVLKFSARLTHQVFPRKSIELRVVEETEAAVSAWVAALNRASFYCKLASATAGSSSTLPAHSSSSFGPFSTPDKKRKTPFYRFRSPTATKAALASSSLSLSAEKERQDVEDADTEELRTTTARWTASYQQLGSVQYLRETDPLLWEIHPPEQIAIRKKAARARTRGDYLAIFSRHAETFAQIFLPRPQPISLEQTLRDILPELFLINDALYGGGEQQQQQQAAEQNAGDSSTPQQNRGLEHIFEVLDAHIQRFAAVPEERVRAVSALLQACARTISGGDSYFVVHRLLGNPNLIIRPAEARGRPIEIDVSPERPSHFLITVFSAFSFHLLDDVERFGDSNDASGGGMTPAPLLRVRTRHIQEFDFASGTSTRWLRIDVEGRKEDGSPGHGGGGGGGALGRWGSRRQSHDGAAESRIGALLDALS
ncbi:Pleckstrin homology-like domain [Phytophthora cinnamomi]|uniref:Pleckstrin homology-like domain n=1 Tax=Phytophthora cinnamomi TaxID=4785 RepID=UPI00355AB84A|nr:Pleckstrin homology-like domain [Phytophthora cinnamomi]